MSRSATLAALRGMPSRSQRRTVRVFTSNTSAMAAWLSNPSVANASRTSSAVMAHDPHLATGTMRALGGCDQHAIDEGAVRILDRVADKVSNDMLNSGSGVGVLVPFGPNRPSIAPVDLDRDARHVGLRSDDGNIGHYVLRVEAFVDPLFERLAGMRLSARSQRHTIWPSPELKATHNVHGRINHV